MFCLLDQCYCNIFHVIQTYQKCLLKSICSWEYIEVPLIFEVTCTKGLWTPKESYYIFSHMTTPLKTLMNLFTNASWPSQKTSFHTLLVKPLYTQRLNFKMIGFSEFLSLVLFQISFFIAEMLNKTLNKTLTYFYCTNSLFTAKLTL